MTGPSGWKFEHFKKKINLPRSHEAAHQAARVHLDRHLCLPNGAQSNTILHLRNTYNANNLHDSEDHRQALLHICGHCLVYYGQRSRMVGWANACILWWSYSRPRNSDSDNESLDNNGLAFPLWSCRKTWPTGHPQILRQGSLLYYRVK